MRDNLRLLDSSDAEVPYQTILIMNLPDIALRHHSKHVVKYKDDLFVYCSRISTNDGDIIDYVKATLIDVYNEDFPAQPTTQE